MTLAARRDEDQRMTFSPGDKVRLVHDGKPVEARVHDRNSVWVERAILMNDNLAALGFRVEPVLEEPPVGSRVRVRWMPVAAEHVIEEEFERERGDQAPWHRRGTHGGFVAWSRIEPHVVAVGEPSFEWREVTR